MTGPCTCVDPRCLNIHSATLELLETTGLQTRSESLLTRCRKAGLRTGDDRIYFSPHQVEAALETAPDHFRLLARNPDRSLDFAPGKSHVGLGRSAAFVFSPDGSRRQARRDDFTAFIKLGQMLDEIPLTGNMVTPSDVPAAEVTRFMLAVQMQCSDKPLHILDPGDLPLLCAAFGVEMKDLAAAGDRGETFAHTTVNPISPLAISRNQADLLMTMADHGIAVHISPTPAMGSSAPCTIAGTLTMNNAEILAVLTISQILRPGLPVLYGVFPSGTDMRSMGATYGSPEARVLEQGAVMMARNYGLLTRGNVGQNESFACDFQAGAEAMFNFSEPFRNQINYLPGAGLLGSFAGASKAKLVLDAELAGYMKRFYQPWESGPEDICLDLISQVGPGGSYISHPHTFSRCRTELHHPKIFCRSSYKRWREGRGLEQEAAARADDLIASHLCPELPSRAAGMVADILAAAGPPN